MNKMETNIDIIKRYVYFPFLLKNKAGLYKISPKAKVTKNLLKK